MGPQRLARETNVTLKEARGFIEGYFETYPEVRAYQERTVEEAKQTGYVSTLLGRRRYLPGLLDADPRIQSQAVNVAVNTPLQGTAADMIKLAMIKIDARLQSDEFRARMLLQIHDELLFEVPEGEVDKLIEMARDEMENALPLSVPLVIDVGIGDNWSEAH
jgi:DNA polymerase-1